MYRIQNPILSGFLENATNVFEISSNTFHISYAQIPNKPIWNVVTAFKRLWMSDHCSWVVLQMVFRVQFQMQSYWELKLKLFIIIDDVAISTTQQT